MATDKLPQWTLSKAEQKREIEDELRLILSSNDRVALATHERYFIAETIGYAFRGLFGMARTSLNDIYEDASQFQCYRMDPEVVGRATPANLLRALELLELAPVQERPVFR